MRKIFNFCSNQNEALLHPRLAYKFAYRVPGADIEKCQEVACKDPMYAYLFALYISGADIAYCQKHVCKHEDMAIEFARDIPGADIEYCRKACESDQYWLRKFDDMIAEKIRLIMV